jgi:hypothetical protein
MIGSVVQQATAAGVELPIEGELPSLGSVTGWLNSQPLTAAGLRGKVVLIDFCTYTQGNGMVAEPRLYQLIRQPKPITDRQFEIEFLSPGVEVFAFTFG